MRSCLVCALLLAGLLICAAPLHAGEDANTTGFKRRGFYLHGCWKFKYPFAIRTWQRADYNQMFGLLKGLGFDTVMLWPVLEAVPPPLSTQDAEAVRAYRPIIDDAKKQQLECWLTQCAAVTSKPEIAKYPWAERSFYAFMQTVNLEHPELRDAYLKHRAELVKILNNADAYVTIDGDPGSYPDAKPAEFVKVLQSDRQTLDAHGINPKTQKIIPWIWAGWGGKNMWREPLEPLTAPVLEALKKGMTEPWEMLPGRSIREGWANSRTNFELTEKAGLINRSVLLCYEIIEFEPTPPAAVLQFDDIRRVLKQEARYVNEARGVFGNAQQPIIVLPNLYLFARGSQDLRYLDKSDEQVLIDFATALGGPPELLVPAWSCLKLPLEKLPADLPEKLRRAHLQSPLAQQLPGGPKLYCQILAQQVDTRIKILQAVATTPASDSEAAAALASAVESIVRWWDTHGYVGQNQDNVGFRWEFTHAHITQPLKDWCAKTVKSPAPVTAEAAKIIAKTGVLNEAIAERRLKELIGR